MWCALHAAIAPVFNMTQTSRWLQEISEIFCEIAVTMFPLANLDGVRHQPHHAAPRPQPDLPAFEHPAQPGFYRALDSLAEHDVENAALGRVGHQVYALTPG